MSTLDKELLSDIGISDAEDVDLEAEEVDQDEENEEQGSDEEEEEGDDDDEQDDKETNKTNKAILTKRTPKEKAIEKEKEKMLKKVEDYNLKLKRKGVCYMSRVPPYMKATYVRKLLESYGVERIYLAVEDERKRKFRMKNGGNKKRCYTEGWVEFSDKRIAKRVALSLNCTKMVQKSGNFYSEDLWNLKYLPKFKWENLTERLAYQNKVRRDKLQAELASSKKEHDFYRKNLDQSKKIQAVERRKADKHQPQAENTAKRTFIQRAPAKKIHNAQSDEEENNESEE